MHCIEENLIIKALPYHLRNAVYEPLAPQQRMNVPFYPVPSVPKLQTRRHLLIAIQAIALGACLLLLTGSHTKSNLDSLDNVILSKTLTIATTATAIPNAHAHPHGLGYDVANRYANHLGAKLIVKSYPTSAAARVALQDGEVHFLLADDAEASQNFISQSASCDSPVVTALASDTQLIFRGGDERLAANANAYICAPTTLATSERVAKFYDDNLLNAYSQQRFATVMTQRLPLYEYAFRTYAKKYAHDWQLLVAIGYQESQLNPNAISPTGVQGIMMLTRDTAKAMDIADRTDPSQSIQGGAKYLAKLQDNFSDIPASERLWFVLAGYNMGPNAVRDVQARIRDAGKDPNIWGNFYSYLSANAADNSRYVQCMHYVTGIRHYLSLLKTGEYTA